MARDIYRNSALQRMLVGYDATTSTNRPRSISEADAVAEWHFWRDLWRADGHTTREFFVMEFGSKPWTLTVVDRLQTSLETALATAKAHAERAKAAGRRSIYYIFDPSLDIDVPLERYDAATML